jgi:anti-sigma B factor antagonist
MKLLQAYTRIDSGVAVLEFNGEVTLGQGAGLLRDTIVRALQQGHKKILLDLEEVSYIDSAGLGELVGCRPLARAQGAEIKLVHLQKRVQGLLQITKLITIFETFDDEYKAVQSFQQP